MTARVYNRESKYLLLILVKYLIDYLYSLLCIKYYLDPFHRSKYRNPAKQLFFKQSLSLELSSNLKKTF